MARALPSDPLPTDGPNPGRPAHPERAARSRSDALAWCVRLVGQHTEDWLSELRSAMTKVDELRRQGPNTP